MEIRGVAAFAGAAAVALFSGVAALEEPPGLAL